MDADLGTLTLAAKPKRQVVAQPVALRKEVMPGDTIHVRDIPQTGRSAQPHRATTGSWKCSSAHSA